VGLKLAPSPAGRGDAAGNIEDDVRCRYITRRTLYRYDAIPARYPGVAQTDACNRSRSYGIVDYEPQSIKWLAGSAHWHT